MRKVGLLLYSIILVSSLASFAFGADPGFIAHLSGDQHTPPVETPGRGQAVFHLSEDGVEISYKIIIDSTSNITMAHIHMAPAGQSGPVVAWLYPDAPAPVPIPGVFDGILAEGTITESELAGDLAGQPLSSLLDIIKVGEAYVNVHSEQNPGGELRGQIMVAPNAMFKVTIENISETPEFSSSGVFNTPDGAAGPGPLGPGGSYKFSLGATPGSYLSLATMFVQSNDLFYAPGEPGIPLFSPDGTPISGDVTSQIMLWDAGTEVNEEPGVGLNQAPRQAGANTGADENGLVQLVNDGFAYPNIADAIGITVTPMPGNKFEVSIDNISVAPEFSSSGVFNTPDGASEPGPLATGSAYTFNVSAAPGSKLSFATMFVQSNDLFYAPDESGIPLFDADGIPISGDITNMVMLWDAGTEINQEPGLGADQAPRQAGPNTGADEGGVVQVVNDDVTYPNIADVLSITATPVSDTQFTISIANISADDSFLLAPGVWVVHAGDSALFTSGETDRGEGLEALAEDGDPSGLASGVGSRSGAPVILAPGVWAVHTEDAPLFTAGQLDRGQGLEALSEDGDPSGLATPLNSKVGVISSGVFNTPVGAAGPGPVLPGASYEFHFRAFPGSNLSFATMFVQSNDLFYAPDEMGIAVFNAFGGAISGDITSQVMLWDAGTEVNQQPGVGPDQAPRQAGANTGADENGNVQIVNDGYSYPSISEAIRVSITMVAPPEPPEEPPKDYSHTFFMNVSAGLNMISLPLEAVDPLTARSFAEMVDSTVVIKYDTQERRFYGFATNTEGNGFAIEGGQGYIINRMTDGVVTFVGAAWENEPSANAAPPIAERNSAWAFVVTGKLHAASDSQDTFAERCSVQQFPAFFIHHAAMLEFNEWMYFRRGLV